MSYCFVLPKRLWITEIIVQSIFFGNQAIALKSSFVKWLTVTNMATKAEKEHFGRLADLGCILCIHLGYGEGSPAEIHHIRKGGKRSNAPVIALCPEHHRGNSGIHLLGSKGFYKTYNVSENDLLEITNRRFAR